MLYTSVKMLWIKYEVLSSPLAIHRDGEVNRPDRIALNKKSYLNSLMKVQTQAVLCINGALITTPLAALDVLFYIVRP